jgi:N-acyl-D-amino-acid deacylase
MSSLPDLVIRGGTVFDGTSARGRSADVSVRGERIEQVGGVKLRGAREIDASGLALAPGFIDVHTHDDFAAVLHPDMAFKVCGGVTTCVVGNCGFGAAPWRQASLMARAFHPKAELPEWQGYEGYLGRLEAEPPSVNIGALVGHGTLRLAAMGNEPRPPTSDELGRMEADLREGLAAGALGLSTGLIYDPGRHAATEEIVALASQVAETGGLYATHMRNEADALVESVEEAIEIGERAGVPVQISHHKAAGRKNWGSVRESLACIEAARARGLEVHADQYPYTAGSTVLGAILGAGGRGAGAVQPEAVVLASTADHPDWEGRSLADLAVEWGVAAPEAGRRALAEEPGATVVVHMMCEEDVRTVMRHPTTMIGSDGIPTLEGRPHPRLYGTFARVLGHYAREEGLFPLEEAIHRMTGLPARVFGLGERGVLRGGAFADLVVFDAGRIIDRGTFEDPNQYPDGIAHVFVNGTQVVRDGAHTGERPGRALRRGRGQVRDSSAYPTSS